MFSKKDYDICIEFLPYLINNDPSGLTDEEIESLDNWLTEELKELGNPTNYHFDTSVYAEFSEDYTELSICDISLMMNQCLRVTLLYVRTRGQLQFITI